jgi:hypothetical protein
VRRVTIRIVKSRAHTRTITKPGADWWRGGLVPHGDRSTKLRGPQATGKHFRLESFGLALWAVKLRIASFGIWLAGSFPRLFCCRRISDIVRQGVLTAVGRECRSLTQAPTVPRRRCGWRRGEQGSCNRSIGRLVGLRGSRLTRAFEIFRAFGFLPVLLASLDLEEPRRDDPDSRACARLCRRCIWRTPPNRPSTSPEDSDVYWVRTPGLPFELRSTCPASIQCSLPHHNNKGLNQPA